MQTLERCLEFDLELTVPASRFDDCIKVSATTPLEPGHESIKYYCPHVGMVADHVGMVADGDLKLTAIYKPERSD